MKFNQAIKLLASIIICLLAGVVGSFYTDPQINGWYAALKKPFFNPPEWVFGPVWTALFILMGVSLYLVWSENFKIKNEINKSPEKLWNKWSEKFWNGPWQKINIILIFVIQLLLNILWSIIFFGLQDFRVAFIEIITLWIATAYLVINFYRVSKWASYLLLPYILWISFAGILNLMIWLMN